MKVLVTGGGGFLGGAIVRRLVARGDAVRTLQRGEYPALAVLGVECVRGDLSDAALVQAAVRGCDAVIHTAAKAGVWGPFEDYYRANVVGTRNVLAACRAVGVKRLVYTSSPSVVFDGRDEAGIDETAPYPARYLAHYPRTKAEAERAVLAANGPELATVALRPHLIWGPGDPHLLPRLVARAQSGKLRLVARDDNLVDSTYVDNAALAHVLALDALSQADAWHRAACAGRAYFISNGEPLPMAELVNKLLAAKGVPPVTRTVSPRLAYAAGAMLDMLYKLLGRRDEPPITRFVARQLSTSHWYDLTAARRDLGYEAEVSLAEGLARIAAENEPTSIP
ncbi:MAG: 3-beta hydroxysteroid dehydrogenase [Planctomycetota bacterium]|nr:MAG: 3-beta hydroxysteroid dehydrogenase [Planctomycetota bacterium]